jgi:hypothetical protein
LASNRAKEAESGVLGVGVEMGLNRGSPELPVPVILKRGLSAPPIESQQAPRPGEITVAAWPSASSSSLQHPRLGS